MEKDPPSVIPTIPADAVKTEAASATARASDGREIETSVVSGTIEVAVSVETPSDLDDLAADKTFQRNL